MEKRKLVGRLRPNMYRHMRRQLNAGRQVIRMPRVFRGGASAAETQRHLVFAILLDGKEHHLTSIMRVCGRSGYTKDGGVTARIRELREKRFGCYEIYCRTEGGVGVYRMALDSNGKPVQRSEPMEIRRNWKKTALHMPMAELLALRAQLGGTV